MATRTTQHPRTPWSSASTTVPTATGSASRRRPGTFAGERSAPGSTSALVRLLLDCAEICRTSADFMIRGSDAASAHLPRPAPPICARCADECDRMGEDPYMAACAEICRRCAESCGEMAEAYGVADRQRVEPEPSLRR